MARARANLDLRAQGGSAALKHQTISKVITGAVVILVDHPGTAEQYSDKQPYSPVMVQSMTEPAEATVGTAAPVNVLHLLHPIEWIAPAYNGGQVTLTLLETWSRSPYQEAGFRDADEFLDVINHNPFTVRAITYKPNGSHNSIRLKGCRVLSPIQPQQPYARETTTRTMNAQIGYTRLTRYGF